MSNQTHPRLADAVGDLERCHASEVGRHRTDQQLHLHPSDLGHVVVLDFDVGRQFRNRVADRFGTGFQFDLQVLLDLANQLDMLLQQVPIFHADHSIQSS